MERSLTSPHSHELQHAENISRAKNLAEKWIRDTYTNSSNMEMCIEALITRLDSFLPHISQSLISDDEKEHIRTSINACADMHDIDVFTQKVLIILQPLITLKAAYSAEFEQAQAASMNDIHDFSTINRLLSYKKDGHMIHIHAPAGETVGQKISLYRSGMRELAQIVNADPTIQKISATSHLVAEHPSLFKKLGFSVEHAPQDIRDTQFANEEREIKFAHISREEFLSRFLKDIS